MNTKPNFKEDSPKNITQNCICKFSVKLKNRHQTIGIPY